MNGVFNISLYVPCNFSSDNARTIYYLVIRKYYCGINTEPQTISHKKINNEAIIAISICFKYTKLTRYKRVTPKP